MNNKYFISITLFLVIITKKYYDYKSIKKKFISKETQSDLNIQRINQLEEYELDLNIIDNCAEQYKWKFIN